MTTVSKETNYVLSNKNLKTCFVRRHEDYGNNNKKIPRRLGGLFVTVAILIPGETRLKMAAVCSQLPRTFFGTLGDEPRSMMDGRHDSSSSPGQSIRVL